MTMVDLVPFTLSLDQWFIARNLFCFVTSVSGDSTDRTGLHKSKIHATYRARQIQPEDKLNTPIHAIKSESFPWRMSLVNAMTLFTTLSSFNFWIVSQPQQALTAHSLHYWHHGIESTRYFELLIRGDLRPSWTAASIDLGVYLITSTCQWLNSLLCLQILYVAIYRVWFHPLSSYPGPLLCRISILPSLYWAWTGDRHLVVDKLHKKYGKKHTAGLSSVLTVSWWSGKVMRLEPNLVSICTPNAIKSKSHRDLSCQVRLINEFP